MDKKPEKENVAAVCPSMVKKDASTRSLEWTCESRREGQAGGSRHWQRAFLYGDGAYLPSLI